MTTTVTKQERIDRATRHEADRQMGIALARRASAALRKAGLAKAGRYTPFGGYVDRDGRQADGFIAKGSTYGPWATILFTQRAGRAEIAAHAAEALAAAGMAVEIEGRDRDIVKVRPA